LGENLVVFEVKIPKIQNKFLSLRG